MKPFSRTPKHLNKNAFTRSVAFACSAISPWMGVGATETQTRRPNFIWIISEDNSVHYSNLYSETGAEMPNISNLAREGLLFQNTFSVVPVCSAARSTLATGCYPSRIGIQYHRHRKLVDLPENTRPVFEVMHDAGYYTSFWKKHDYNFEAKLEKWNSDIDWAGREEGQPFFHKHVLFETHESQLQKANFGGIESPEFVIPRHPDTPLFRQAHKAYNQLNRNMDDQVGLLVERLREDGLLEDTFIFYMADHGGVLPGSKGYLFETGLHVPFVIRIPENFRHLIDYNRGARLDGFVEFIDIGPTTLHLAGIPVPEGMDGTPFLGPDTVREEVASRDEALGIADRFDEKYDLVRSLRKGNLKYIRSYQPFNFHGLSNIYRYKMASWREWLDMYRGSQLNELQASFFEVRPAEELYDVVKDPYETINLALDPAYREQLINLRDRLTERLKDLPDLGFCLERDLLNGPIADPVAFGEMQYGAIGDIIDLVNLQLLSFTQAQIGIHEALVSDDFLRRYWALVVCTTFGNEADAFIPLAKSLAVRDPDLLVRARAVQFLALIGAEDPEPLMLELLGASTSEMETTLLLNILTQLRDGKPGYTFDLKPEHVRTRGYFVDRCLVYLCGIPLPQKPVSHQ